MAVASDVRLVLFDYGGVLAEEGFRQGLMAIARRAGLDPAAFFAMATEAVYATGYVTGQGTEADFWQALRQQARLSTTDQGLTREILSRFRLRPTMLALVRSLRDAGLRTAILSDQTNWLDELEARQKFSQYFETVFNSFHTGISKRDPASFTQAAIRLSEAPGRILLVDDNEGNIQRAMDQGLQAHLFVSEQAFADELRERGLLPGTGA